ncbi:MAG TPA: substrate-binding domain-containing protein [Burkholderiales bacterium]|nr:substrate-binding domain-containing protein [Burkholderiales bacterium]
MATILLFVSNSMRGAMDELVPRFERASGHRLEISYDPAKVMMARIRRGESADLAMLGGSAIEELVKDGKVTAGSRRVLASCGVGIAVRAGAHKPDIGSVEAFRQALLAAGSVAWTQEGASGMYFSKLIESLGIAAEMQRKAVRQAGGLIGKLVAEGKAELAVQQIPELLAVPGIELLGPLPREIQQTTVSSAGIFTGAKEPKAAGEFLDFLQTPGSAGTLRACGHEPAEVTITGDE